MIALENSFDVASKNIYIILLSQGRGEVKYWEAECVKIDAANNNILCRSNFGNNLVGDREFLLEYDYLVIAVGAQVNTFNTPGVMENCHFLKVKSFK